MIRYSNSFFISLIFHSLLLLSVWFFYNNDTKAKEETPPKIPIKLSIIEAASQTAAEHQAEEEVCIVQPQEIKPKRVEEIKERAKDEKRVEKIVEKIVEKKIEKREEEKVELKREEQTSNEVKVQKSEMIAEPQKSVAQEIRKEVASEQKTAPKPIEEKSYEKEYYELNVQRIVQLLQEHLYYPRSARQKEIIGVVKVKCILDIDAKVHDITVVESSDEILSRAAIKTIENLSTKFPKPKSQTTLTIPITYSLTKE